MLYGRRENESGQNLNDRIHNLRECYQHEFERLKGISNKILKSALSKEEKKAALIRTRRELANAARLVKRAYRFYEWLPEEIISHQFGMQYALYRSEEESPTPHFEQGEEKS